LLTRNAFAQTIEKPAKHLARVSDCSFCALDVLSQIPQVRTKDPAIRGRHRFRLDWFKHPFVNEVQEQVLQHAPGLVLDCIAACCPEVCVVGINKGPKKFQSHLFASSDTLIDQEAVKKAASREDLRPSAIGVSSLLETGCEPVEEWAYWPPPKIHQRSSVLEPVIEHRFTSL
jgi:hypothetical protein